MKMIIIMILGLLVIGCAEGDEINMAADTHADAGAEAATDNTLAPVFNYDGMTAEQFEASMAMWSLWLEKHGQWQGHEYEEAPVTVQNDFTLYVDAVAELQDGADAQEVVAEYAEATSTETATDVIGGSV